MLAGCGPETDDPRPARAPGDAGPGSGGSGIRRWCAGRSGSGSGTDPYAAVLPFYDVTRVDARRGTVRTVPRAAEARARRAGALPLRDSIGRTDAGSRGAAAVLAGCVPPPSAPAACVRCRGAGRRACPRGYRLPHPSRPVLAALSCQYRAGDARCEFQLHSRSSSKEKPQHVADTTPRRRAGPRRVAGSVWMRAQSVAALYVLNRAERRAGGFDLFFN